VRIPLDYYRILGLPVQASHEQLQQAYRDRILQLPRREYSEAAIAARKQLLEAAYTVLSEPKQRTHYDARYLTQTYESEAQTPRSGERSERSSVTADPHTPSIEIPEQQFVGALLILQELGEYELVLKLGRFDLSSSGVSSDRRRSEPDHVPSDIILTVTLACLELGREQWHQGQYENAAASLENGQELLLSEKLFSSVQAEIQTDLYKLRPYRILELLAQPEEDVAERRQGLQLLQNMLQDRGGIDGTGDDRSGLGIDDFLRFIQQLRRYLTAAEQQSLFEAQSQHSSAVATYLVVYALIARGFAQRLPALIAHAKLLLLRLSKHQDLHLEQAVCSLLLGQTEQASRALEQSHEYEALAFIRKHSQGSPDLLPGLCLYSERWLQTEVFPRFRDLAQAQASLKDYFADEQVQTYLEALPTKIDSPMAAPQPLTHQSSEPALVSRSDDRSLPKQHVRDNTRGMQTSGKGFNGVDTPAVLNNTLDGVPVITAAERISEAATNQIQNGSHDATTIAKNHKPRRSRRQRRSASASHQQVSSSSLIGNVLKAKQTRLVLLVLAGVLGIAVLGLLVRQSFLRVPPKQKQQPQVLPQKIPVAQPPSPIAIPSINPLVAAGSLTQAQAQAVIQTWLSTKAAAFGPGHTIDSLKQILVDPALAQWQQMAQSDKANNLYLQYKHSLKVDSVTSQANSAQAQVQATVNELAQAYKDGKLDRDSSYNQSLKVRYGLVRQNGQWRINEISS